MKICVLGLWHLGTVTAACLAAAGHQVIGLDFEESVVEQLRVGQPPLFEPGLAELVKNGIAQQLLSFTTDIQTAVKEAEIVWVAYDTPVDEEDNADVEFVVERVIRLFPYLSATTLVLISSQLPVGTTRRLEQLYVTSSSGQSVTFAYSPENLRLGKAIHIFTHPDRVVVGIRAETDKSRILPLLLTFTQNIEWMSVESAEMTKHALNAFLATSVTFANEIAILCEQVGADAKEVERGLKSEARIGPKAYLSPGAAFAGGTLARDINFLTQLGKQSTRLTPLLSAVRISNESHKLWTRHKLQELLGEPLAGQCIAIWGLTYKPGTDTLRRSSAIELCQWLIKHQARVQAHDPAVKTLPAELAHQMVLCDSPMKALEQARVLVVATEWPEYQTITADTVTSQMITPIVLDPNRFLVKTLGDHRIKYLAVGSPQIV